ncbi:MAG: mannonate dehydratase [Bacilli bacterium]|nr:mannonate dehydratase [Bacilli bacterium]
MKLTFRWYGKNDCITLSHLRQIPNMSGVVTACYSVPVGEVWPREELAELRDLSNKAGLEMEVIESIPVHEDIKLGKPTRERLIENYCENLRRCAEVGVKCVCYNFMPVFDWLRTEMHHQNADGSNSLSYSYEDFQKVDPHNLHLPGWDESYSQEELQGLLEEYSHVTHEMLFDNLVYFLKKVIPVCDEVGISMAIHPDDPPWDVFGLPRIVSNEKDLDKMFEAVPSKNNGLTLCTGSFGAGRNNDLVHMAAKYASEGRVHFLHLRNIKWTDDKDSFCEVGHCTSYGSLDMAEIVLTLVKNGFKGYVRPDHGRNIWGEDAKPGYGLYDRALGATYINGLFEMAEKIAK